MPTFAPDVAPDVVASDCCPRWGPPVHRRSAVQAHLAARNIVPELHSASDEAWRCTEQWCHRGGGLDMGTWAWYCVTNYERLNGENDERPGALLRQYCMFSAVDTHAEQV